jgi:hypothetical protein
MRFTTTTSCTSPTPSSRVSRHARRRPDVAVGREGGDAAGPGRQRPAASMTGARRGTSSRSPPPR